MEVKNVIQSSDNHSIMIMNIINYGHIILTTQTQIQKQLDIHQENKEQKKEMKEMKENEIQINTIKINKENDDKEKEVKEIEDKKDIKEIKQTKEEIKERKEEIKEKEINKKLGRSIQPKQYEQKERNIRSSILTQSLNINQIKRQRQNKEMKQIENEIQKEEKKEKEIKEQKERKEKRKLTRQDIETEIDKDVQEIIETKQYLQQQETKSNSQQPIDKMTNILRSYCHKTSYVCVFDSDFKPIDAENIWMSIKGRKNIMFIIKDSNGNVFGSYHSVIPSKRGDYEGKDFNHFVFSLKNAHEPKKFTRKNISPPLKIYSHGNGVFVVNGFIMVNLTETFFVSNQRFWRNYFDETDKGIEYFCGENSSFEIESLKILEWR